MLTIVCHYFEEKKLNGYISIKIFLKYMFSSVGSDLRTNYVLSTESERCLYASSCFVRVTVTPRSSLHLVRSQS